MTAEGAVRRFAVFDVNGDGQISKDEYELNRVVAIFGSREHERAAAASGAPGRRRVQSTGRSRLRLGYHR